MINPSTWEKVMERSGVTHAETGTLEGDPFRHLSLVAATHKKSGFEPARMNVSVHNGTDYSQIKVVVTCSVVCAQDEQHMQLATEAGFLKALEMVNEASESLGIPTLPVVY